MPACIVTLFLPTGSLTCGAQRGQVVVLALSSVEPLAKEFPPGEAEHLNLAETESVGMRSSNSAGGSLGVMVEQGQRYIM